MENSTCLNIINENYNGCQKEIKVIKKLTIDQNGKCFDEFGNFIGIGKIENGILKVDRNIKL